MRVSNRAIQGNSKANGGQDLPLAPALAVVQAYTNATLTTAVDITINSDTSMLRVSATTEMLLRFKSANQTGSASATDFDEVCPAGQLIDIGVPTEVAGSIVTAVSVFAPVSSAVRVIQK